MQLYDGKQCHWCLVSNLCSQFLLSFKYLDLGVLPGSGFDAKVSFRTCWRGQQIQFGISKGQLTCGGSSGLSNGVAVVAELG